MNYYDEITKVFSPVRQSCSTLTFCAKFSANDKIISGSACTIDGMETYNLQEVPATTAGLIILDPFLYRSNVFCTKKTFTNNYKRKKERRNQ